MESRKNGTHYTETYRSMADYADRSAECGTLIHTRDKQYFRSLPTHAESVTMCRHGWSDKLAEALEVAESAVTLAEEEHMVDTYQPVWDVSGALVDVGAYLAGVPECMVDYPATKTSKSGRVITLVAPICYSAAVQTESIERRGMVMAALAMALNRLGHSVEIWIDMNLTSLGHTAYQRVCVKNVNDELDPAMLMFAIAHPAMLRRVAFGTWDGFKGAHKRAHSVAVGRGGVGHRTEEDRALYPEGTIFLPGLGPSSYDVPGADKFLREYLGELGLLAE